MGKFPTYGISYMGKNERVLVFWAYVRPSGALFTKQKHGVDEEVSKSEKCFSR